MSVFLEMLGWSKPYLIHYASLPGSILYLLLSCVCLALVFGILYLHVRRSSSRDKAAVLYSVTERFYELAFSGTSILLFMSFYYLIDRFMPESPARTFWDKYCDLLLLAVLVLACMFNRLLDRHIAPLKHISSDQVYIGRLLAMLYMILIFCYIKFIYENNNYDPLIKYFLVLIFGRFIYFDVSFRDSFNLIRTAVKDLELLLLLGCYSGIMCFVGFKTKYLLIHNGVLTNTMIAHLFMCLSIAVLVRIDPVRRIFGVPTRTKGKREIS